MRLIFDKYYATSCGNVFSKKTGKILKPWNHKRGYLAVKISVNGKTKTHLLHRLIARAFYGESDLTVDHIDNNKSNNRPNNLKYMSAIDNHKKASIDGAIRKGTKHPFALFSKEDIEIIRSLKISQSAIAKIYKTNSSVICRIINKRTYKDV